MRQNVDWETEEVLSEGLNLMGYFQRIVLRQKLTEHALAKQTERDGLLPKF